MPLILALALALAAALAQEPPAAPPPPGEKPVDAYVQSNANAGATPVSGTATFAAFHGLEGVRRVAADFVARDLADPRIKAIFADADTVRLQRTLTEQICYLLNGGCAYTGRDMQSSHKGLGSTTSDFNALVENLQAAMDKEKVPFADQNVLLAKLAPMKRTTVERTTPAALTHLARRLDSLRSGQ